MFKKINELDFNKTPFEMIGKNWMLITAGDENSLNTMTASWGGLGVMWNKNVVFAFIRPSRNTFKFINDKEYFSCCFFDESYRDKLLLCGTKSGRDIDKVKECNFTPVFDEKAPYFKECNKAIICKKIYCQEMSDEFFTDNKVFEDFKDKDFHYMYIGEITDVLEK